MSSIFKILSYPSCSQIVFFISTSCEKEDDNEKNIKTKEKTFKNILQINNKKTKLSYKIRFNHINTLVVHKESSGTQ